MYSREHALLSLPVGAGAVAMGIGPLVAVPWALAVGVGIDLDHFLVARLVDGDWAALTDGLREPRRLVVDQDALFVDSGMDRLDRLLSHAVLGGVGVGLVLPLAPDLAVLTGVTLYVHVLADLVWDVYETRVVEE